jgi:chromosomal replication initiation ATPase DnaA
MTEGNIWTQILERIKAEIEPEEFRRWFSSSTYASDSGDVITVWVPSAAEGRQISQNYIDRLRRELARLGRADTLIRFIATGYSDDEDDEEGDERDR